jgi:hypothetical protein
VPEPAWSRSLPLKLGAADLWDLLWRPETQALWLGPGSDVQLHAGRRCALRDEAGVWRSDVITRAKRPERVELAGGTAIAIAAHENGCALTISDLAGGADVERYWTRRLELVRQLAGAVARRRSDVSQAVIVIHGIGEQHPGATLSNLVASGALAGPVGEGVWVKPDRHSESFELRKVQFKGDFEGRLPSTDVFELYWAHMIRDTRLGQVIGWARKLLLRRPPPRLIGAWATLWLLIVAVGVLGIVSVAGKAPWLAGLTVVLGFVWRALLKAVVVNVLGDAPRYLLPLPDNIALRQSIREAGVDLIERLHGEGYDRIVILGHSLGSVIAYDIITNAWIAMNRDHCRPHDTTFTASVAVEKQIGQEVAVEDAQRLQHVAWNELRANTQPWRVTDLVTVGSPLTYADYLLAGSRAELDGLKRDRILPACPPQTELEASSGHHRVTYDRGFASPFRAKPGTFRTYHHGAPFAVTRWTNLYFKSGAGGLTGDIVGGPVAPLFGPWIRDVELAPPRPWLAHTLYWRKVEPPDAHLAELREALGLRARPELVTLLQRIPAYALSARGASPERAPGPLAW